MKNGTDKAKGAETAAEKNSPKRSVSAPATLFEAADKVAAKRRIHNFSEYVRDLMRKDIAEDEKPLAA